MKHQCTLYITLLVLAGCMSGGKEVTSEQIAAFKPGITSETDIIAALGEPSTSQSLPDGTKMDSYTSTKVRANPSSFIPIVGMLNSGIALNSNMVMFNFDANGILLRSSATKSHNDVNTGLLNQ